MIKFIYTADNDETVNNEGVERIEMALSGFLTIDDLCTQFQRFLSAQGYIIDPLMERIQLVRLDEEADLEEDAPADSWEILTNDAPEGDGTPSEFDRVGDEYSWPKCSCSLCFAIRRPINIEE